MERYRTARNVAIIVLIAAAIYFIPGGGRAASTFETILWAVFAFGFAYFALRLYREHRVALHSLGDRHRALAYAGVAVALFAWIAHRRMWDTGLGTLVWVALVAFVLYSALEVFRHSRSY